MDIRLPLPKAVLTIMDTLAAAGFRADAVGGCVRDALMGKAAHDYDMTTDATPEQMKRVFMHCRVIETGIRHGTLTIMMDGAPYELTTYRIDGAYADGRHPDSVCFTASLAEDLARRDFTVNAMAYHPVHGLTDLFMGQKDLKERQIRAVGDPKTRFHEDALRILRALRFASVLDFTVEPHTAAALRESAPLLSLVAYERLDTEWYKLLGGTSAAAVLRSYFSVIRAFLPELTGLPEDMEHHFVGLGAMERMLYLFSYMENAPSLYIQAMERFHADNRRKRSGEQVLVELLRLTHPLTDAELLFLCHRIGAENAKTVLLLAQRRLGWTQSVYTRLEALLAEGRCYRVDMLAVSGGELLALGLVGTRVGRALSLLLDAVITGACDNDPSALLALAAREMQNGRL